MFIHRLRSSFLGLPSRILSTSPQKGTTMKPIDGTKISRIMVLVSGVGFRMWGSRLWVHSFALTEGYTHRLHSNSCLWLMFGIL